MTTKRKKEPGRECFQHSTRARLDAKLVNLRSALGLQGYGAYWALLEMLYESPTRALKLDYEQLAAQLGATVKLITSVITDFDLFVVDSAAGLFYSAAARLELDESNAQERRRLEISEKRRQAVMKRWSKRRANSADATCDASSDLSVDVKSDVEAKEGANNAIRDDAAPSAPNTRQEQKARVWGVLSPGNDSFDDALDDLDYVPESSDADQINAIIPLWNAEFNGTKQEFRGFTLSPIGLYAARSAFKAGYTLDDLKEAFHIAKNDEFAWTLAVALKPDNIQILLAKGAKQNERFANATGLREPGKSNILGIDWSKFEDTY